MRIIAGGLIAYASFWIALRFMGVERVKSAWSAAIPAVYAMLITICNMRFHVFEIIYAGIFVFLTFVWMLYLTGKKWIPSLVSLLLGLGICLNGQILIAAAELPDIYQLAPGVILYMLFLPLWKKNSMLFQEDFDLTRDQKKSVSRLLSALIPGPLVFFLWSIFVLIYDKLQIVPILIFNYAFLLLVCQMLKSLLTEMREHLENLLDKQYQKELLGFMHLIRSQRHDFNFHMQTIYGMLAKEQYADCRNYIDSMLSIVQSSNDILPLEEPAISALLNTFQELAMQKGLKLEVEIHDNLAHLPCTVYEINTILGNLLQNAIDELERNTEGSRVIHLLIMKRGNHNMIKVSNVCHLSPEAMRDIFIPGFTTKPLHEGLGLANAKRMAEKYGGLVYPEFEDQMIHMIAKIPMKRG